MDKDFRLKRAPKVFQATFQNANPLDLLDASTDALAQIRSAASGKPLWLIGRTARKVDAGEKPATSPVTLHPAERELLHAIEAYPRALTETVLALSPSILTTYAFGLASAFSDFYEHTPAMVREEDPAVRGFRRALVAATRATLADALHSLGIAAPDQV